MNTETKIHVLWGIYKNPCTPENKRAQARELLAAACEIAEDSKLVTQIKMELSA